MKKINSFYSYFCTFFKGLAECLSSIRSRPERSGVTESPSISTESSADSSTPLNKALPLLQRVRMLGEQERKAAANKSSPPTSPKHIQSNPPTEVIGEGKKKIYILLPI